MIRHAHHERNQYITVRPEPVEGLNQSFLNDSFPVVPVSSQEQVSAFRGYAVIRKSGFNVRKGSNAIDQC